MTFFRFAAPQAGQSYDYPTLGFFAVDGAVLDGTASNPQITAVPDAHWTVVASGPESGITRYRQPQTPPDDQSSWDGSLLVYDATARAFVRKLPSQALAPGSPLDAAVAPLVPSSSGSATAAALSAAYARNDVTALKGATLYGYGHSYVAGTGASDTAHRFIQRFGVLMGASSVVNNGYSGDASWQLLRRINPTSAPQYWTPGTKALIVLDCVLNDLLHTTAANAAQDLIGFTNAMRTALRLLRAGSYVPCTDASMTFTGTWSTQANLNGSRTGSTKLTSTVNDTATIANYTATEVTIMSMALAGNQTKFDVSVGGTVYGGTLDCSNTATTNGYQINAYRVTGLPTGTKTLTITNRGGGGNNLYIDGYLTPPTTPPSIIVVRDAALPAYNTSPFDKPTGDQLLANLNNALSAVVRESEFNYPFQTIDMDAGMLYDPSTMVDTANYSGIHRNDAGHEALAQALLIVGRNLPYRAGMH